MSTRVCTRCRRPLPVPSSDGAAAAPCPFCAAADAAGRASEAAPARSTQPRSSSSVPAPGMTQSAPPVARRPPPAPAPRAAEPARRPDSREDPSPGKKRSEAFASALVETARTTPVHSFAVPTEAIPVVNQPRRRTPAPASASAAAPSANAVAQPPAAAAATAPPRRAAVTATLASLGPAVASAPGSSAVRVVGGPAAAAPAAPMAMAPVYHGGGMASAASATAAAAAVPARAYAPAQASPAPAAPALALVQTPPPGGTTPPPASAPATSSARGADAWNISSYLDAPAGASPAPAGDVRSEPVPAPQPTADSVPVDFELRGRFATLLDRLPARRLGIALGCAALVAALGVGGFKLLGRSRLSARDVAGTPAAPAGAPVASADLPAAKPASGSPAPALPALVMPKIADEPPPPPAAPAAAEAPPAPEPAPAARSRARGPQEATPVVREQRRAVPAPKTHARAEKAKPAKPAARPAKKTASASKSPAHPHRRVSARASASTPAREDGDAFETDRMARARETYRQGNERLFSGDAAGAVTAYEETIRLNPKDPAGYRGLGLANAQLGKRTEAVRHLRAYLKHAPNAEDRAIITSRISLLQTLP